jgi:ferredoxin-NADP reductase
VTLPTDENGIIVVRMAQSAAAAPNQSEPHGVVEPHAHRDHGFHTVRVARVVTETADSVSLVLDVPEPLREAFAYEAGQFCTFRALIDEETHLRCYSMSSAPAVDDELKVTVKRVPEGIVSNWMNESLSAGDEIDVTLPAGVFCLTEDGGDVVALAAGSGITPVISLVKQALATTSRRVHLLYANRDLESTIFRAELDALVDAHPDRLRVQHHLDVDDGFVDADATRRFAGTLASDADVYVCGPTPFMDIVEDALLGSGVDPSRFHIERFAPAGDTPIEEDAPDTGGVTIVTIELDGRTDSTEHRAGTTILQTARQLGMAPPFSCESGNCATCMARLLEGTVTMHVNNALTDEEVEEGWVLTCQSVPTSDTVRVIYGYD